jgi:hypothetical protein
LASPARFSRSARKPRLESCPLYAGRHLASQQAPARLLPGHTHDPGFGVVAVLSTRHRGFAYAHLSSPHLTGAPALSMTLTTGAFDPSRSWRFGASPCRATPKGLPSSSVQPRDAEGTGHHLERNLVIVRGHGFNSSAAPPGDVGRHEGWASHGARGGPAGIGLGLGARGAQGVVVALVHFRLRTQGQVARVPRDQ